MTVSVLTIARGRDAHLANLVLGLSRQEAPPLELVVGVMDERRYEGLPDAPFPIRQIHIPGEPPRLAAARNAAAAAAIGDDLVFLDVDCIPAPSLTRDYATALAWIDGLLMGEVRYLPAGANAPGWSFADFAEVAEKHCDRQGPPASAELEACHDYRCFWSLNFAMRRATFARLGGFDESYVGYGGEDTDFGRVVATAQVPILWRRGALAFHQHHVHYMPPVHHIRTVLANAQNFRRKWGEFTMGHWIHCFELMGLVWREGTTYRIVREPVEADFALCRQHGTQPYASSAWVAQKLKADGAARLIEAAEAMRQEPRPIPAIAAE